MPNNTFESQYIKTAYLSSVSLQLLLNENVMLLFEFNGDQLVNS